MDNRFIIEFISDKKGRGVIAEELVPLGTIIDIAQVLVISEDDYYLLQNTLIYGYIFEWEEKEGHPQYALAMSPSEFINHSYEPNTEYELDYANKTIIFKTIKDIEPGEEVIMNYNGHGEQLAPVWFEVEN
jgi:hypothetical protein